MISPDRKRKAVKQAVAVLEVSERRACRVMGQHRSTRRYPKRTPGDEVVLTERIIELASEYGRYGYRRVTALLRNEGWIVNHKFAVIDVNGSDPTVILGSYNWTDKGAYDNDENTLIIHDQALAQAYYAEWQSL